jgi:hypothetical protein
VYTVAELLFALLSVLVVETVAALVSVVALGGVVRTTLMVAVELAAIVPRAQLRFNPPLQVPCDGVAETKVREEGSVSATVTPVAEAGPRS